jgi:hypothetical protein
MSTFQLGIYIHRDYRDVLTHYCPGCLLR